MRAALWYQVLVGAWDAMMVKMFYIPRNAGVELNILLLGSKRTLMTRSSMIRHSGVGW